RASGDCLVLGYLRTPGAPKVPAAGLRLERPQDPLQRHRLGGAETLSEQAHPQLFDQPADVEEYCRLSRPALLRLTKSRLGLLHVPHPGAVAVDVAAHLLEPPLDAGQV